MLIITISISLVYKPPRNPFLFFGPKTPLPVNITFYIIVGANQKLNPDLRGHFWEYQLANYTTNFKVHYVSNYPLSVNGIDFITFNETFKHVDDRQFCVRAPRVFRHFAQNHPSTKWFFRGTHDTFINVSNLIKYIQDAEKKINPMNEYGFGFNMHEYGHKHYPHGGTGWLMSNYAVKRIVEKEERFRWLCDGSADDVAMAYLLDELGVDYKSYASNKFIVTWPNTQNDVIFKKDYREVQECPEYYELVKDAYKFKPAPIHETVSIHMHREPMNVALELLSQTPDDFAVTFLNPNLPVFCRLKK